MLIIFLRLVGKQDIYVGNTMVIGGIKIRSNDTSGTVRDLGLSGERYVGVMTIRGNKTSGFWERRIKSLSVN